MDEIFIKEVKKGGKGLWIGLEKIGGIQQRGRYKEDVQVSESFCVDIEVRKGKIFIINMIKG